MNPKQRETRRQVDKETRRQGEGATYFPLPLVSLSTCLLVLIVALVFAACSAAKPEGAAKTEGKEKRAETDEVSLSPEAAAAAKLEYAEATSRPVGGRMRMTGTVEANQQ